MKKFMSVAVKPGQTGEYYYNSFFKHFNLNANYTAVQCLNLNDKVSDLRKKEIAGLSVSMPFKKEIISYLDKHDKSVERAGSCNTVKIVEGIWVGYNTDIEGVLWSVCKLPTVGKIQILGDGSMSELFQKVLDAQGRNYMVFSRKKGNWNLRHVNYEIVINTTALGTFDAKSPLDRISGTEFVVDLSLKPGNLSSQCLEKNIGYISGLEFYKKVFLKQFYIYTSLVPDPEIFDYLTSLR
jgi:shikimate dehydrogenase